MDATTELLLAEIRKLQEGQEALRVALEQKELTASTSMAVESNGIDLAKIMRTEGPAAAKRALRDQNRRRAAEYRRRGLAV